MTEFDVGLALDNVAVVPSSTVAGESLDFESRRSGIFVAELPEDEPGAIFRSGFTDEGFDV